MQSLSTAAAANLLGRLLVCLLAHLISSRSLFDRRTLASAPALLAFLFSSVLFVSPSNLLSRLFPSPLFD